MTELPQKFKERMKAQLGDEYEAFLASYEKESLAGLRVNTRKISPGQFEAQVPFSLRRVPWTENGFYVEKDDAVTRHPYYYAGLYYIQEPSAMLPASRLPIEPGDMVLDLCAAPGGKSTELASRLAGTGFLVANDVSASRAKALLKNLSIWGCSNFCVTGETPEHLLDAFGCCFDKILVDAPCSGEGMFRKDRSLIDSWLMRGPEAYAPIQRQILDCAVQMLKKGGMLLYSTCTFAEEEDEQVISWILDKYPQLHLVQAKKADGLAAADAPCEKALRAWPHRIEGEGHFLALLQKDGTAEPCEQCGNVGEKTPVSMARTVYRETVRMPKEVAEFAALLPEELLNHRIYREIQEQCLLLPEDVRLPARLRYLRTGLLLGTRKNGRFEPSQPLAMMLDAASWSNVLDLPAADERVVRYLKGETIELSDGETQKKGWVLVCVDGFALGWGKAAGGSIKNKYYPGWRMQ